MFALTPDLLAFLPRLLAGLLGLLASLTSLLAFLPFALTFLRLAFALLLLPGDLLSALVGPAHGIAVACISTDRCEATARQEPKRGGRD